MCTPADMATVLQPRPAALWALGLAVLLLGLGCLPGPLHAEKLYTARDANGNLVFSDVPVAGSEVVAVQQVEVASGFCASVSKLGEKDDVALRGVNDCYGPVEVRVALSEARNIRSDRPPSFSVTLPARSSRELVRLRRADPRQGFRYALSHTLVPGDPQARHLPPRPYLPPVPAGQRFPISQAFHGALTHGHPQSEYAVDIPMAEGTPVHAARGGVIMEVANDFFTGGTEERFAERANFIRILHKDGTMALYAHLQLESLRYPRGSRVAAGQLIAASGNTGYSSGPHLHFAIQQNLGGELRSIPFVFAGSDGTAFAPEPGLTVAR